MSPSPRILRSATALLVPFCLEGRQPECWPERILQRRIRDPRRPGREPKPLWSPMEPDDAPAELRELDPAFREALLPPAQAARDGESVGGALVLRLDPDVVQRYRDVTVRRRARQVDLQMKRIWCMRLDRSAGVCVLEIEFPKVEDLAGLCEALFLTRHLDETTAWTFGKPSEREAPKE